MVVCLFPFLAFLLVRVGSFFLFPPPTERASPGPPLYPFSLFRTIPHPFIATLLLLLLLLLLLHY